jgi:phytol kinase
MVILSQIVTKMGGMTNPTLQNGLATGVTLALAITWLHLVNRLAQQGQIEPTVSRKIIHIGTGPLFVLCWPLFSDGALARVWAALVPLAITVQFIAIGTGLIRDSAAVQAMTRHGEPAEILRGPLYYGLVFIFCTLLFWRTSPVGILALMILCGGDGLADLVGRRWGNRKLPGSPSKSWAGSTAMLLGSWGLGYGFVLGFNALGYVQMPLEAMHLALVVGAIALVATLVEALPLTDIDNLTLTVVAIAMGLWLL